MTFERPASWTRWQPNAHAPITGGPLIYLSTEPLSADCATSPEASPNPPDVQGFACEWPLSELGAGGVFVDFYTTRILQPLPTSGEVVRTALGPARFEVARPGDCKAIKGDVTMDALLPMGQPSPLSNIGVFACLHGPDIAAAEAKVRALVASVRIATP